MVLFEKSKWQRYGDLFILLLTILFSIIFMVIDQNEKVTYFKHFLTGQFSFLNEGVNFVPRLLLESKAYKLLRLEKVNRAYQKKLYQEVIHENQRLRKLLGFKERMKFDFIAAEVVGHNLLGGQGLIQLNAGWMDGCQKNLAMVSDLGLIGKVVSINRSAAVGQIMTDPNFRVSARIQRSRVLGIVRWLYGNICMLEGVSEGSDVMLGDRIVTSGYSQIYSPGIGIGHVIQINQDSEELFMTILLRTEVNFGILEEVFIMKPREIRHEIELN